ncbi:MULE domain-containing protein [Trichonephila clavata]|uniref:MULE domain-containing protein n=1 Tax=Trichonephila clavata TaxID=2740835 RepID=A0A8X6HJE1_TRICU|nr:MULE domain-containing protein [Trichonephila clavata]
MKAEDFLLVIMNASQKDMLKFYGNDTICLDFTHGINAYGFDLATLLVLDDKREGFPAAFILSNRQDSTALKLAFAAIKEHACIAPKVLMTDDTESFLMPGRLFLVFLRKDYCVHGMWIEVGDVVFPN